MMKIAITGCKGRMGQRIIRLACEDQEIQIGALLEHPDHPQAQERVGDSKILTDISQLEPGIDVMIDFTSPEATLTNLAYCAKNSIKMVIGTTGLSPTQIEEINKASSAVAIVFASNMSVCVNLLFKLTQIAASKTKENYTIAIQEAHHIHKKDAPSGTAKTIAQIAEQYSSQKVTDIDSIREGEIVGDHTIVFESEEDVLTISHHAKTRDIFAKGALVAAKFLQDKQTGLFTMQDVLGLT